MHYFFETVLWKAFVGSWRLYSIPWLSLAFCAHNRFPNLCLLGIIQPQNYFGAIDAQDRKGQSSFNTDWVLTASSNLLLRPVSSRLRYVSNSVRWRHTEAAYKSGCYFPGNAKDRMENDKQVWKFEIEQLLDAEEEGEVDVYVCRQYNSVGKEWSMINEYRSH